MIPAQHFKVEFPEAAINKMSLLNNGNANEEVILSG